MPTKENDPWWAYFYIKHLVHKEAPPLTTGKDAKKNKASAYAYSMQNYMNNRQVYCVITDQYGNRVLTEVVTIHLEV